MTPKEKAKYLVNEKYYQPITIHLNVNNNSKEMWEYAKRCAFIVANEIIDILTYRLDFEMKRSIEYWESVKIEISKL